MTDTDLALFCVEKESPGMAVHMRRRRAMAEDMKRVSESMSSLVPMIKEV